MPSKIYIIVFLSLLSISVCHICSKSCDTLAPRSSSVMEHSPVVSPPVKAYLTTGGTRAVLLENVKGAERLKSSVFLLTMYPPVQEAPKMYPPPSTKSSRVSFTPPSLPDFGFNNPPGMVININQTTGQGSGGPAAWIYVVSAVVSLALSVFGFFKYRGRRDSSDNDGISEFGLP